MSHGESRKRSERETQEKPESIEELYRRLKKQALAIVCDDLENQEASGQEDDSIYTIDSDSSLAHSIRLTHALISQLDDIWKRIEASVAHTEGNLTFCRTKFEVTVSFEGDRFSIGVTRVPEYRKFQKPPEIPKALCCLRHPGFMNKLIPSYRNLFEAAFSFDSKILHKFLEVLKNYCGSLQVWMGEIEAWKLEESNGISYFRERFGDKSRLSAFKGFEGSKDRWFCRANHYRYKPIKDAECQNDGCALSLEEHKSGNPRWTNSACYSSGGKFFRVPKKKTIACSRDNLPILKRATESLHGKASFTFNVTDEFGRESLDAFLVFQKKITSKDSNPEGEGDEEKRESESSSSESESSSSESEDDELFP